ncbi:hypothetical protein [Streptomyces abyssomicinicus]|uniref:hypothetical protein n=1 Tax=Streptomyces abyssomicinicus TaxID=574929 RepID=UPI001250AD61|nr:hypothetical protein [Streptomyces abyssomicinicus]
MFQETPIYNRLVAERGDIPVQVRGEAERIHRSLTPLLGPPPPPSVPAPAWQPHGGIPAQGGIPTQGGIPAQGGGRPHGAPSFPELP